ncbi:MAG: helicase-associated domain-containing protein [Aquiluna sp.]|nr:helicase-associated domain-containing protein [Aquiluna sp.]
MSSILELASQLRAKSSNELTHTLERSLGQGHGCDDYFDLSRVLLSRRELEPKIRSLGAIELDALRSGTSTKTLVQLNLSTGEVLAEAQELSLELEPQKYKPSLHHGSYLSAYETLLCVTELLFACERHWLDVIRAGIRSQDAKEIALKLKLTPKDVQRKFQLAVNAGLIGQSDERWVASKTGMAWLEMDRLQAWLALAQDCWDLPEFEVQEGPLAQQVQRAFPLVSLSSIKILEFGADLGLVDQGEVLYPLTLGSLDKAAKDIAKHLPEIQDRILVQGDLSIVSTGPISTQLHRKLDTFADSEDLGLASRFRISPMTVSHALETGMSVNQILKTLEDAGGKTLPQPLEYVLKQASERFGQLRVLNQESGTIITSEDTILLTQIANEHSLRGLMLQPIAPGQLATRLGLDLVYFNLREAGYAAVMFDGEGKVRSPRVAVEPTPAILEDDKIAARVANLMSGDKAQMGSDDVLRQLQFAQKNKLMVQISVEMQDGNAQQFTLSVLGIAAGRLRGKDQEKDAERTLPVSRIQSVVLV